MLSFAVVKASLLVDTVQDRKETAVLGEVFHEPSTVPFRPERKRVRTVSTKRRLLYIGVNSKKIKMEKF